MCLELDFLSTARARSNRPRQATRRDVRLISAIRYGHGKCGTERDGDDCCRISAQVCFGEHMQSCCFLPWRPAMTRQPPGPSAHSGNSTALAVRASNMKNQTCVSRNCHPSGRFTGSDRAGGSGSVVGAIVLSWYRLILAQQCPVCLRDDGEVCVVALKAGHERP